MASLLWWRKDLSRVDFCLSPGDCRYEVIANGCCSNTLENRLTSGPLKGPRTAQRPLFSQLKMTHDLSRWMPPPSSFPSLCSLLSQPVAVWRNVPFRSDGRVVSSGEFPVGMSHDEGGVGGGGIVRLDLNPLALATARPQDKLTCGIWTYKNAMWTFYKNCLKSFF